MRYICYALLTQLFVYINTTLSLDSGYTTISHTFSRPFTNQKCATFATLYFATLYLDHLLHFAYTTICLHQHYTFDWLWLHNNVPTLYLDHLLIKNAPHLPHFAHTTICLPQHYTFGYTIVCHTLSTLMLHFAYTTLLADSCYTITYHFWQTLATQLLITLLHFAN